MPHCCKSMTSFLAVGMLLVLHAVRASYQPATTAPRGHFIQLNRMVPTRVPLLRLRGAADWDEPEPEDERGWNPEFTSSQGTDGIYSSAIEVFAQDARRFVESPEGDQWDELIRAIQEASQDGIDVNRRQLQRRANFGALEAAQRGLFILVIDSSDGESLVCVCACVCVGLAQYVHFPTYGSLVCMHMKFLYIHVYCCEGTHRDPTPPL
jgi:hypothetical protein